MSEATTAEKEAMEITVADLPMEFRVSYHAFHSERYRLNMLPKERMFNNCQNKSTNRDVSSRGGQKSHKAHRQPLA